MHTVFKTRETSNSSWVRNGSATRLSKVLGRSRYWERSSEGNSGFCPPRVVLLLRKSEQMAVDGANSGGVGVVTGTKSRSQ